MRHRIAAIIVLLLLPFAVFEWIPGVNRWLLGRGLPAAIGDLATSGPVVLLLTAFVLGVAWLIVRLPQPAARPRSSGERWQVALAGFGLLFVPALAGRLIDPGFDEGYARAAGLLTAGGFWWFLAGLPFWLLREELFLRFSQRWLTALIGGRWAIIALSIFFAILHYPAIFPSHAWSVLPGVFLGSVVLAAVFQRTQSLWRTYAVHLVFDAIIALQIMLHASGNALGEIVLWAAYGIAFLLTIRRGWREFVAAFHVEQRVNAAAVGIAGVLAVTIPVLVEFVL